MKTTLLGLTLLISVASTAFATDIYVWKDANGRTQYTQFPPIGNSGTVTKNILPTEDGSIKDAPDVANIPANAVIEVKANIAFEKKVPTFAFLLDESKIKSSHNNAGVVFTLPSDASSTDMDSAEKTPAQIAVTKESDRIKESQCLIAKTNIEGLAGDAPVVMRDSASGELRELKDDAKENARVQAQKAIDFYCN